MGKIFLVEEKSDLRMMYSKLLTSSGHIVVPFSAYPDPKVQLKTDDFGVFVINSSPQKAMDFVKKVREVHSQLGKLPIIALVDNEADDVSILAGKLKKLGVDFCIQIFPDSGPQLLAILKQLFSAREQNLSTHH